ncbi:MAG: DUF5117 domain-containing protein [Acidobacteria bacterium]|nr:DUF5117 domain-containing protein [Acidobacteriota bacterium]
MRLLAPWLLLTGLCLPALAQQAPADKPAEAAAEGPAAETKPKSEKKSSIKPYSEVIPEDAVSDDGVFRVHRVGEEWFFEIPVAELGREFLMVTTLARSTAGVSFGGEAVAHSALRWERRGERVLLLEMDYSSVADPSRPIASSVARSANALILKSFPIRALGPGDAPVIEVSDLFAAEITELSPRRALGAKGFDRERSFIESIRSYPLNVEIDASQTYTKPPADGPGAAPKPGEMRPGSATVGMRFSMVLLPEVPMQPRLEDERVGYFNIEQTDYGVAEHKAAKRSYITRWRLEKKDPAAERSEPVRPIVYYIDPATPPQWVPYIQKGVEAWRPVFEEAGFLDAIQARPAPTPEQDPDWSAEDARYSVIRWISSPIQNAYGPHVHDPRSGEILEADIGMFHNVLSLVRNWYFVQASPLDPRAGRLPLPDDLMGDLVAYVVTHEVGHTLGLPHNMKSSSLYPFEKIRDPAWVRENGHVATLMDYARFNYVAQPEDGIAVEDLIPKIGPYDRFSIRWGYTPIPQADSAEAEKETLNHWIVEAQDATPWLRFSSKAEFGVDPGAQTEAVGDADAVQATTLGLRNLERVMQSLPAAVAREGEPYDDLQEIYDNVVGQWAREMGHVATLPGGYEATQKRPGQEGALFEPVERSRQAEAVGFLLDNALVTPKLFLDAEILRRIEPSGAIERLRAAQGRILAALLDAKRLQRLFEQEAVDGSGYTALEMLGQLRQGLFREAGEGRPADAFRRNLQRQYVESMVERIYADKASQDDQRALFRAELRSVAALGSLPNRDEATRTHFEDLAARAAQALDPAYRAPAGGGPSAGFAAAAEPELCWPDLRLETSR